MGQRRSDRPAAPAIRARVSVAATTDDRGLSPASPIRTAGSPTAATASRAAGAAPQPGPRHRPSGTAKGGTATTQRSQGISISPEEPPSARRCTRRSGPRQGARPTSDRVSGRTPRMTTDQDHYLVLGVDPSASARAGRGRGKPGRAELPPGGVEHRRGMGVLVGIHATYDIDRLMLLCHRWYSRPSRLDRQGGTHQPSDGQDSEGASGQAPMRSPARPVSAHEPRTDTAGRSIAGHSGQSRDGPDRPVRGSLISSLSRDGAGVGGAATGVSGGAGGVTSSGTRRSPDLDVAAAGAVRASKSRVPARTAAVRSAGAVPPASRTAASSWMSRISAATDGGSAAGAGVTWAAA